LRWRSWVPGLAGHDPWKSLDAIGIGIVHDMALSRDLLVPHVASWTWLNDAPLYFWVALAFGKLFQLFVEFLPRRGSRAGRSCSRHAGCSTGRRATGRPRRIATPPRRQRFSFSSARSASSCTRHEALPELATLAALSGALAVLPQAATRLSQPAPVRCRAWPRFPLIDLDRARSTRPRGRRGPPCLPGMARPQCSAFFGGQPHRRRCARHQLAACALRPFARAVQGMVDFSLAAAGSARHERVLLSFHWKLVRVAGLAARGLGGGSMRRRLGEPRLFVPAFASLAALFGAAYMGPPQDVNLLALLAPLALLASQGVLTLRRGAAAALDWFGVITFAFFVGLIWLGYTGMMTGVPPKVAAQLCARRARVHARIQHVLLPLRGCADARLVLHRAVRRACAAAQRGALGRRRSAALGNVRDAVDALGRLPEELPLGGTAAALQDPGRRRLRRGEAARRAAGGGARLPCRPAAARVRHA